MIFFMYFWKGTNELYAWTSDKDIAENFEMSRCMKKFKKKKVELDDIEAKSFMYTNRVNMLHYDVVYDGENNITIAATGIESVVLDDSCSHLVSIILHLKNDISKYPLKKKYLNLINKITDNLTKDKKGMLTINTFKLFIHLNGRSFGVTPIEKM